MRAFIEGFWTGFIILVILACMGLYVYLMYRLMVNDQWLWVAIVAGMTFCIGCGITNMDFDD